MLYSIYIWCLLGSDVLDLSINQLQFVLKLVLLRVCDSLRSLPVRQTSGTYKGRFRSSKLLASLLRTLQSIMAEDIHRRFRIVDQRL